MLSTFGYVAGKAAGHVVGKYQANKALAQSIEDEAAAIEKYYADEVADLVNQYQTGMIDHQRYTFLLERSKANCNQAFDELERKAHGC